MKTIRVYVCECGEDVYEDDRNEEGELECINCLRIIDAHKLRPVEIMEITHESD